MDERADLHDLSMRLEAVFGPWAPSVYAALVSAVPGEAGEVLRENYYRQSLRGCGARVRIGCRVAIVHPEYVVLGDDVTIEDDVKVIARGPGGITIGNGVTLKAGAYLDTEGPDGFISLGDAVYVGVGTVLYGHNGLSVGPYTLLAQQVTVTPFSHRFEQPNALIIEQGGYSRPVTIGSDVYIGMHSTLVYRADVGDGAVVGAGSVVVHPVEPYTVVAGVPARVLRQRPRA